MAGEAAGEMLVGVVGGDEEATEKLSSVGLETVTGTERTVLEANPDAVVAVGEQNLFTLVRREPSVPVLPVDAGSGVRSVPGSRLSDVAARLVAGNWETESHELLSVEAPPDATATALMDAMAVTAEPAHISEFTLAVEGEQIARFRADGIVAATPAGTPGYARSAGAPVVPPGPSVLALAPVAPFATTLDHWVVPSTEVTITIERDEATVEVMADDRTVGTADVGDPIELSTAGTVEMIHAPEGRSPFAPHGEELEKL